MNVRIIGGSSAGRVIDWDVKKRGTVINLTPREPGGAFREGKMDTMLTIDTYHIHEFVTDGVSQYYAIIDGSANGIGATNVMEYLWTGYERTTRQSRFL